jgi:uncharacterized protein (TIGR02453 family)
MPANFPGFSPKAITFLRQLKKNNDRAWFQPRKTLFEELIRNPMIELATLINDDLRLFAVDHLTDPKKAVHRIYRDTRFSKDKTPYKTRASAMFPRAGLGKEAGAQFYYSLSAEGLHIAAGMFWPDPAELKFVRSKIADNAKKLRKLIEEPKLMRKLGKCQGESAVRVPKDFPADHPAQDLLRRKSFYFASTLETAVATGPKIRREIVDRFKLVAPMVAYLNELSLERVGSGEDERPVRPVPMF